MPKKKITTKKKKSSKLKVTPIVAVMGHVDHGKTSILDAIRQTKVQEGEAGGITQNTRAHLVKTKNENQITFIDTPGHEAFSEMRSRGARVTDIVLLVVAADDGVQPQTKESIKFAKKAKVPIVVAINKIDAPGANPEKVKQELSSFDVLVEKFGGDVLVSEVSATKKQGLDELIENIELQAEMMDIKRKKLKEEVARGFVLESNQDKRLGPVALVILKSGELEDSKTFLASGSEVNKIRQMLNEEQKHLEYAKEGEPIWIIGLNKVLVAGDEVVFFDSKSKAQEVVKTEETRLIASEQKDAKERSAAGRSEPKEDEEDDEEEDTDEDILAMLIGEQKQEDDIKKLNVILKTDTQGTLEAVKAKLEALGDEEVQVSILEAATGEVTGKDIDLAKAARAIIIAFQVNMSSEIEKIAKREKVLYRNYDIIYELLEEVEAALDSLVEPIEEEVEISRAKVKKVFTLSNGSQVAGSEVTKGIVLKGYSVFVERGGKEVGRGKITSIKHAKEEVKEIKKGQECGILIEPQIGIEEGDEIVCYKIEKI